jgi:hypothetical protein
VTYESKWLQEGKTFSEFLRLRKGIVQRALLLTQNNFSLTANLFFGV